MEASIINKLFELTIYILHFLRSKSTKDTYLYEDLTNLIALALEVPKTDRSFSVFIDLIVEVFRLFPDIIIRKNKTLFVSKEVIAKQYPKVSIIGIMTRQHHRAFIYAFMALLVFWAVVIIILIVGQQIPNILVNISLILGFMLIVREYLFAYRVRKGLFGKNEHEAREILVFILKNSKSIDFTDGGKPKKLVSDEDLEEIRGEVMKGLPQGGINNG